MEGEIGVRQSQAQKYWGSHQKLEEAGKNSFLEPLEGACPTGVCMSSLVAFKATKRAVICYRRLRKLIQKCLEEQRLCLSACAVESDFPSSMPSSPVTSCVLTVGHVI